MIDSLLQRLNVPVKHRARATPAHTMPNSMHIQPFLSRLFTAANSIAYVCIKDLRAAAGDRAEAVFTQKRKRLWDRHFADSFGEMTDLNRGESFVVRVRVEGGRPIGGGDRKR